MIIETTGIQLSGNSVFVRTTRSELMDIVAESALALKDLAVWPASS